MIDLIVKANSFRKKVAKRKSTIGDAEEAAEKIHE